VEFIVELAVEGLGVFDAGRRAHEKQLAVHVVLEDVTRRAGLVRLTETLGVESTCHGVRAQELRGCGNTGASLLERSRLDVDAVHGLEETLRDPQRDEPDGARVLAHLVDGQDAVADEVGFREGEVGEYETGAVAQDDALAEVDGLEVLRLTRCGRDGHLLGADECVDCRGLADVRVADQADLQFVIRA